MQPVGRQKMNYGAGTRAQSAAVDAGLRAHMLKVYNYMAMALALTGIIAWYTFKASFVVGDTGEIAGVTQLGATLFGSPLAYVLMFAPLGFVLVMSFGIYKLSLPVLQILYWSFAAVLGVSLASIFATYQGADIARVFFISAVLFGSVSLWGYTTKRDISSWGGYLIMGVWGLFIALIVNTFFFQSSQFDYLMSFVGVALFTGLTAWDNQMIKNLYLGSRENEDSVAKLAVMGALHLYLDFINIFLFLLRIMGGRR